MEIRPRTAEDCPRRSMGWRCACLACPLMLTGCGDAGPSRAAVMGTITVNGQPLESGSITFIPTEDTIGSKVSGEIVDGAFDLARRDGPVTGHHRVEIWKVVDSAGKAPPEPSLVEVSPRRKGRSTLVCEATADGSNRFTFDLTTRSSKNDGE